MDGPSADSILARFDTSSCWRSGNRVCLSLGRPVGSCSYRSYRTRSNLAHDLAGLPAALVMTGELDPLRDEGELYASRLLEASVDATVVRYESMIHGFFGMAAFDRASTAVDDVVLALRSALAP